VLFYRFPLLGSLLLPRFEKEQRRQGGNDMKKGKGFFCATVALTWGYKGESLAGDLEARKKERKKERKKNRENLSKDGRQA
jgi:hypothetical protein